MITGVNRYAYAYNNPYLLIDPDGHSPATIGMLRFVEPYVDVKRSLIIAPAQFRAIGRFEPELEYDVKRAVESSVGQFVLNELAEIPGSYFSIETPVPFFDTRRSDQNVSWATTEPTPKGLRILVFPEKIETSNTLTEKIDKQPALWVYRHEVAEEIVHEWGHVLGLALIYGKTNGIHDFLLQRQMDRTNALAKALGRAYRTKAPMSHDEAQGHAEKAGSVLDELFKLRASLKSGAGGAGP